MEINGYFKTNNGIRYKAVTLTNEEVTGLELNPVNGNVRANAKLKTFKLENIRFVEMTKDGQTRRLSIGKSCFSTKTTLEFYGIN